VGYCDVLLPEFYQRDDLIPLGARHRLTKTYFDHGAIWGNVRHSVRHDARHNPLRGTRMLLTECVANYASPVMLDLCAMDYDATGTEELATTFGHIRSIQMDLRDAEPVRHAALLHSRRSHELAQAQFDEAFEGMYRLLLENHMQFDIVNEEGIQRGELARYKVLVVPDAVSLHDKTAEAIRKAAKAGLGVVATHMTGLLDPSGNRRARPALADLFGIKRLDGRGGADRHEGRRANDPLRRRDLTAPRLPLTRKQCEAEFLQRSRAAARGRSARVHSATAPGAGQTKVASP